LITQDQKGNRYIWDATNNYGEIIVSSKVPPGRIVKMDSNGYATIVSQNKIIIWDIKNEVLVKETDAELARFGDIDNLGNILSLDFNECSKYNTVEKKIDFILKHPNWLREIKDYPDYQNLKKQSPGLFTEDGLLIMDGYHMQLTMARFARNRIYTASIDRTIRVWDKDSGTLIRSLTGHKATVNKIKLNTSETQLVSVDLKGGIKFWDIINLHQN
jgi:WD40 repeat protein